jgi:hypothetical protein
MRPILLVLACALSLPAGLAHAQNATASLTIANRAFSPTELEVPAGQKIDLHIKNTDKAAAEFESESLHREKVVPPGQEVVLSIGPLKPGRYEFIDDFNPKARGHIVVK